MNQRPVYEVRLLLGYSRKQSTDLLRAVRQFFVEDFKFHLVPPYHIFSADPSPIFIHISRTLQQS